MAKLTHDQYVELMDNFNKVRSSFMEVQEKLNKAWLHEQDENLPEIKDLTDFQNEVKVFVTYYKTV